METFQLKHLLPEKREGEGKFPENKLTLLAGPRDKAGFSRVTDAVEPGSCELHERGQRGYLNLSLQRGRGQSTSHFDLAMGYPRKADTATDGPSLLGF